MDINRLCLKTVKTLNIVCCYCYKNSFPPSGCRLPIKGLSYILLVSVSGLVNALLSDILAVSQSTSCLPRLHFWAWGLSVGVTGRSTGSVVCLLLYNCWSTHYARMMSLVFVASL